jgi:hypothetical protein
LASDFIVEADYYQLDRLKALYWKLLVMNLNKENAHNSLALAVDHNCLELRSACVALQRIPYNFGAVVNTA